MSSTRIGQTNNGLEYIEMTLGAWYEVYRQLLERSRSLKASINKSKMEATFKGIEPQPSGNKEVSTDSTASNVARLDLVIVGCFQEMRGSLGGVKGDENLHTWIANSTAFFSSDKAVNDEKNRTCLDPHVFASLQAPKRPATCSTNEKKARNEDIISSTFIDSIERQECMQKPYSTIQGHIEILVQFGIIAMFAPVFPLGPLLAFLNNILEIRMEISGAVDHTQRFCSYGTKEPDIFLGLLTFISALSVMISCAVILLQTDLLEIFDGLNIGSKDESAEIFDKTDASSRSYEASHIIILIIIEHVVLAIKLLLFVILPDVPEWVELAEVAAARVDIMDDDGDVDDYGE